MTRPKLFLLIGIAFTVVVIGVIVTALVLRYALPEPVTDRLSEHALTPEETFTEVAPHRDGTVQIRQRLIFQSPTDDGGPVGLWISDAALGRSVQSGNRLAMMPKISALRAVELSTAEDSTRTSPKTLGELDIAVDEKKTKGFDHPAVHFMFSPKDSQGTAVEWSEGRHVIGLEYVLDEVFMTVAGEEFFALPVPMLGIGHLTLETHTLSIDTAGPVYCPAANGDFDLGDGCDAAAFSRIADSGTANNGDAAEDGTQVVWRKSSADSREVIAFDPPARMTASPVHAYERQG